MTALEISVVPIRDLKTDPRNARKHSAKNIEAIAKSLAEFGQRRPLVVRNGIVLAGNGTLEAAKRLGWEEVAVTTVPASWSNEQARAFALADNRTAELAEWNHDALLESLQEIGEDLLEAAGFVAADLSTLTTGLDEHVPAPGSADFAEIPEADQYQQQYGVNVICEGPDDQMEVFELMSGMGYKCRVVTV